MPGVPTRLKRRNRKNRLLVPRPPCAWSTRGGRVYFHSAPDERCRLKGVFVVTNDRLEVFADHGAFTEVIYWHPVTGAGTAGWVPSARLAEMRQMLGYTTAR